MNYITYNFKDYEDAEHLKCFCHKCGKSIIMLFALIFVWFLLTDTAIGAIHRYHDFVSVKAANGIPMSGITALTRDDDGFVWGASRMGIIRATPSNVSNYVLPVSTSDIMQMKLAYNKGVLVAATQNGQIFTYDRIKDRFEQSVSLTEILGNKDWISNILVDDAGLARAKGYINIKMGNWSGLLPNYPDIHIFSTTKTINYSRWQTRIFILYPTERNR